MNHMQEAAIQALRSSNVEARLSAAEYLRDHPHSAAIEPLIEALSDNSVDVAYRAAEALISVGSEAEAPLLSAFEQTEDESTRYLILVVLSIIGTVQSEGVLIEALHSGNPSWVEVAAEGLYMLNTPNARRALEEFES